MYSKYIHIYAVYIFYTYIGYYSAIKKNKIMPYVAICMDLEIFKVKEVNEKHIVHMITYVESTKSIQMNLYTKQK